MEYLLHSVLIVILLGLIIYDCVLFTNSAENFGKEYNLSNGVVGGLIAAIGTALPETIVPLVAVIGSVITEKSIEVGEDIALGAVLGSPFLLSTVAFFVTGLAVCVCSVVKKRTCKMCANPIVLIRDLKFFAVSYSTAILCAFIPSKPIKFCIATFLFAYYFWYVYKTIKKDFGCDCEAEMTDELIFAKTFNQKRNKRALVLIQIAFSLIFLVVLAHFFVNEILYVANALKISPIIISLLLAPIATELPECFNSTIWIGQTKDTLSISNITGALVFQSCIPAAIGITLTPWKFDQATGLSVVLVYCSLLWVYTNAIKNKGMLNHRILISCGLFYVIYIIYILTMLI